MKKLQPLLFLLAGAALMFMFSFKPQEEVKEYAMLRAAPLWESSKGPNENSIIVYTESGERKIPAKRKELDVSVAKVLNDMMAEGWTIVSASSSINLSNELISTIHLVRTKR